MKFFNGSRLEVPIKLTYISFFYHIYCFLTPFLLLLLLLLEALIKYCNILSITSFSAKMWIEKQPCDIERVRMREDDKFTKNRKHSSLLPNGIRALIIGPSASGKTNIILSMLLSANGLRYQNVYVYSKSIEQEKYQFLGKVLAGVKGIGYFTYSNNEDVIPVEDVRPASILIFDDISCERQQVVRNYFSRGRHKDVDIFYLCHSYSGIPKHNVRDNANFLIILKTDYLNLMNIYKSHVNTDMSFTQFQELCNYCWREPYDFIVIDKESKLKEGRYRKCFNEFISM